MLQYPLRFLVAYAVLGAVLLTTFIATLVVIFTPITPVAHKSDITKALGTTKEKDLVQQAEKSIASGAKTSGITITEQKAYKVTYPNTNEVDVFLRVTTVELGNVKLKVIFHKGLYSIARTEAVK